MLFFADLHVHSRYSRATSKGCGPEQLFIWGQQKGLGAIATGDITHPAYLAELKEKLVSAGPGVFKLRPDLERAALAEVPAACRRRACFVLSVEISTIYKKGDRTRKVHHVVYVPDFDAADRLVARLSRVGNLASDGRPILGLDSRHLLEMVLESGTGSFLVPAHIWTPWFSALGSSSGFDSIDECYGDLTPQVFAVETGLSSDPPMNWRISGLDRFRLVSNSDAHSPAKLGREATCFDCDLDYFAIRRALETGQGYAGTVEFFPEEGKYHLDGHRTCKVRLDPARTRECGGLCPVCQGRVTIGVMHRVEELADRQESASRPATAGPFRSLIPLSEMLGEIESTGPDSKKVRTLYERLTSRLGSELEVLSSIPLDEIRKVGPALLVEAISRLRRGEVIREAGYDGEYGTIRLFRPEELQRRTRGDRMFEPSPLDRDTETTPAPGRGTGNGAGTTVPAAVR
ncbi:MAG: AAA family ATPase, partial [Candidatus Riflebacteria bacterium]|nr:AAA family ATPase [Candidatus Riflebacteria bacterium]